MNEALQEYVDSRGVPIRVDAAEGVIRGVKILGLHSRNGRQYLPAALAAAASLYEGAKVNVNHPKGHAASPRDYQDRIGVMRGVAVRPQEGLFGDLHFNPKHALAEQLAWDAVHAPENVGFSQNVEARTTRRGDTLVVEAITKVQSVDLVADPATTRGLFESQLTPTPIESAPAALANLTLEQLRAARPDLCAELIREQADAAARLQQQLDTLNAQRQASERQSLIRSLLAEYQLPDPATAGPAARAIVSPVFVESLLAAPDEAALRQLMAERAQLINEARRWDRAADTAGQRPQSRDQTLVESQAAGVLDARHFARAIT